MAALLDRMPEAENESFKVLYDIYSVGIIQSEPGDVAPLHNQTSFNPLVPNTVGFR